MVTRSVIFLSLICLILSSGCGENSPLDHQDSFPQVPAGSLTALQFPTGNGCRWKYQLVNGNHSYTLEISGTKNMGGDTVRILKNDSLVPIDQIASLYSYPVSSSFFKKDLDSYKEYAYDLLLSTDQNYTIKNIPKRVVWEFPLYVGKEWEVGKTQTIIYTRKVISSKNTLGMPAGTFDNVYYVEEYANIPESSDFTLPPNKYWLVPYIGVIKYEYTDLSSGFTNIYQLAEFVKGI